MHSPKMSELTAGAFVLCPCYFLGENIERTEIIRDKSKVHKIFSTVPGTHLYFGRK